jgi:hypothetical protein
MKRLLMLCVLLVASPPVGAQKPRTIYFGGHVLFQTTRHQGPSSYTPVTTGSSPSGGDIFFAAEAGLKWIDYIIPVDDETGAYSVDVIPAKTKDSSSVRLRWNVRSSGTWTEVSSSTSLSSYYVHLLVIGRP